jgi:hypothetical protein
VATEVCKVFKLANNPKTVCPEMVSMMVESVYGMIDTDLISKNRVCSQFLGFCNDPKWKEISV